MPPYRILPLLLLCIATLAGAQAGSEIDPAMGISTMPLWPAGAAQTANTPPADLPNLTVFLPQKGRNSGSAILVAPGGGYTGLSMNLEGRQIADWFASRGFTAFVLKYRLGAKYLYPVPLEDAQRAIRVVRSLAGQYNYSPDHVGMIGFSAGGHLAATAGTLFDTGNPQSSDPVERLSDRPDFLVLAYAWLNAMQPSTSYIWYCSVIKTVPADACKTNEQKYTPALHVTAQTPPTFLYSTSDDKTVPVRASVDFYKALNEAGVPAEMHLFRHGGHGSGVGGGSAALDMWTVLLDQWLRDEGFLIPPH
jgi:acetyl esterase/lipase